MEPSEVNWSLCSLLLFSLVESFKELGCTIIDSHFLLPYEMFMKNSDYPKFDFTA